MILMPIANQGKSQEFCEDENIIILECYNEYLMLCFNKIQALALSKIMITTYPAPEGTPLNKSNIIRFQWQLPEFFVELQIIMPIYL